MSEKQTYANYHKAYYHKNRDKIYKRVKAYNAFKHHRYYLENKERLAEKDAIRRKKARETITVLDKVIWVDSKYGPK